MGYSKAQSKGDAMAWDFPKKTSQKVTFYQRKHAHTSPLAWASVCLMVSPSFLRLSALEDATEISSSLKP